MSNAKARTMSAVINDHAKATGMNSTDAGKAIRSRIRSARRTNEPALLKAWPALEGHEKGNRYPDVPAALAIKLIAGKVIVNS